MAVYLIADSISRGWLAGLAALEAAPGHEIYDLIVEISDPNAEDLRVRQAADDLYPEVDDWTHTVANTIFPSELARTSRTPDDLYARYLKQLPRLIRRERRNQHGTYFGRLIAYPGPDGPVNQVAYVIKTAGEAVASGGARWRFLYDMNIHVPGRPGRIYGFPCLAYINVKLRKDELLITAHYRNHYFVERAYGNYLGIARLQRYIADKSGLRAGPLICISGHAEFGRVSIQDVRTVLREFA
jgi:hypothetical protein